MRFALRFIFSKANSDNSRAVLFLLWIISPDSKCRIAGRFFSGRHCSTSQDSYCRRAGSTHRSNAVPLRGNGDVDDDLVPAGTDRFDFGDGNRPIPSDSAIKEIDQKIRPRREAEHRQIAFIHHRAQRIHLFRSKNCASSAMMTSAPPALSKASQIFPLGRMIYTLRFKPMREQIVPRRSDRRSKA